MNTEINGKVKEISDFFGGNMVMISVMRRLFEAEPDLPVPCACIVGETNTFQVMWKNGNASLYFDNEDGDVWCFFYTDRSGVKYQELDESLSIDGWVYDKLRLFTVKEEK